MTKQTQNKKLARLVELKNLMETLQLEYNELSTQLIPELEGVEGAKITFPQGYVQLVERATVKYFDEVKQKIKSVQAKAKRDGQFTTSITRYVHLTQRAA